MKVSGFTFIRNGEELGYPFVQSICSLLPLVDEFIVCVGHSSDRTHEMVDAIGHPKIKIIETYWNNKICAKGYAYAQQKMMAQFMCRGDWAFYLEGDEIIHEKDYPKIKEAMRKYLNHPKVEALAFNYYHFYGNIHTIGCSPSWYRREVRIIKTSVRSYAPDGLFWVVLDKKNRKGRYPRAALVDCYLYHYGWARKESQMKKKADQVCRYWNETNGSATVNYKAIDSKVLQPFEGSHPSILGDFFPKDSKEIFKADPSHTLTKKERKHRIVLKIEKMFGVDLSKKHFKLVK